MSRNYGQLERGEALGEASRLKLVVLVDGKNLDLRPLVPAQGKQIWSPEQHKDKILISVLVSRPSGLESL